MGVGVAVVVGNDEGGVLIRWRSVIEREEENVRNDLEWRTTFDRSGLDVLPTNAGIRTMDMTQNIIDPFSTSRATMRVLGFMKSKSHTTLRVNAQNNVSASMRT